MKIRDSIILPCFAVALLLTVGTGCTGKWVSGGSEFQSSERQLSGSQSGRITDASKDGMERKMEQDAQERGSIQRQDADGGVPDLAVSGSNSSSAGPGTFGLSGLDPVAPGIALTEEQVAANSLVASAPHAREMDQQDRDEEIRKGEAAAAGLNDVFFDYDSWTLTEEGQRTLSANAAWLKANPTVRLRVEGHCDERGTHDYNLILGEKRTKTVRSYLVELGVDSSRISSVSYGKDRPFCREHHEACHQQNRRGHMTLRRSRPSTTASPGGR
ncbi:MAG TPA: peptidoglycan-associated lipoprotein Pal [Nitrospiraceae bacterium]|jgi:peptidoglycan-associated lipoprotein|nr:peptidoglycan-associated lipoprotein Pal [Nitrospiraceae bacterium]